MAVPRMPPLNAVRAFVAAAKQASFSRAASELGVTHGAISKQVRLLEDHLGIPLFVRRVRQVSLTQHGQELLAEAGPAIERIGVAANRLRRMTIREEIAGRVRINARPSFALRWLIPHLPAFMQAHPGIVPEILTSTLEPAALPPGSYDVAIRRGDSGSRRREWTEDAKVRPFLRERARPVASPQLLSRCPVRHAADLANHTLLHTSTRDGDWATWLMRARVPDLTSVGTLQFEHLQFALQAALDGLGVALAPMSLVVGDLDAGRLALVVPRGASLLLEPYCYALAADAAPASASFVKWLDLRGR